MHSRETIASGGEGVAWQGVIVFYGGLCERCGRTHHAVAGVRDGLGN